MNRLRIELCEDCQNSLNTHDYGDYHEMCEAGHCMMCFQCEKEDCHDYKATYHTLSDCINKYGEENLFYYNDVSMDEKGYVTQNPDSALVRFSFISGHSDRNIYNK